MEFYERVSGARLHAAYVRPGGVALVSGMDGIIIVVIGESFHWRRVVRMIVVFGELASGKQKQGRPLKRFKNCVKARISHAEITPKELEPRAHDRTGRRALTRHATDTFEERRRTQIEEARERRKASADAAGNPDLFP